MAMLTKTQLIKNSHNGDFNGVLKELRRYGRIIRDVSYDVEEGFHKGANRSFHIDYKGLIWECRMLNGGVQRLGWKIKLNGD